MTRMMKCGACGKSYHETAPQGLFTAYKAGKDGFSAHFHICVECAKRVKTLLGAIKEESVA